MNLVSSTDEKLKVWHSHYKFLGSDSSGHSLSKDYWKDSDALRNLGRPRQQEWDINQGISDEEICKAISSTPNFKACGPDGIPMEFFKALIPCKDDSEGSSDNNSNISSGFKCLKALINRIWNGDFPKSWNNASIVSIHKKGDLSDCNNYRGISLINNGLKIIAKIIANRISKYGIDEGFIRPEQFGFRNREECISLYTTLRIICQRRKFENKDTYLAFLDLKKAYDSVPIYNVLMKIHHLGIRGKCYNFIENLYLSSKACVRVDGQLSESFNIKKGVHQGCPLSPILFNLFINDIFNNCIKYGISIGEKHCCGGLFADDIVFCAPTRSQLNNEMQFGINKCASLVVRGEVSKFLYNSNPTFYLSTQELPKTNCYTYLGVPFFK